MTSLDDINPGDYIVQVWTWRPKVGQATQTLEALEEAKEIFESHGFLVDLWQHGLGSKYSFNFVMLSNSCLLYTSPSPRDRQKSRMPSSA